MSVQNDVWAESDSCFHIHCCSSVHFLCAQWKTGPIFSINKCDVETWSFLCWDTENGLFSEGREILCPAVKLMKWKKICMFIYSGVGAVLFIYFFCDNNTFYTLFFCKNHVRHMTENFYVCHYARVEMIFSNILVMLYVSCKMYHEFLTIHKWSTYYDFSLGMLTPSYFIADMRSSSMDFMRSSSMDFNNIKG